MAMMYSTSPEGLQLIKRFEGCEKRRPDGNLQTYQVGRDLPTIGWGQTGQMPDGRKVEHGLVITQQEADDALMYFVRNVVDPLVRKHFVCKAQHEHDALASWVYNVNHTRLERGDYSLPRLINTRVRDIEAVVSLWMRYVHTPEFENGLYKRRIAEVLLFLGLPWSAPAIWGYISSARYRVGQTIDPTDPWFIIELADQARPKPIFSQPDPPAPPAPVAKAEVTPLPPLPEIDLQAPPKPMEQSKTHRGLSKAESGQETVAIGTTMTALAALLPFVESFTAFLSKYSASVILTALFVLGLATVAVGWWRWCAGRLLAQQGRREAKVAKI